jgi:hypothetical protein
MEQVKPTEAPEVTEVANAENRPPLPTLEILIARMMQTHRDIRAYHKGEMSKEEFDSLGITFG